jgi:hypothetical protein
MLQQCSSACRSMRARIVLDHVIIPNVSIPRLLFLMALRSFLSVSQYTSDVIVVPCCMNSTISTPFLSQKTVSISFLTGRQSLFKLFRVVW